MRVHRKWLKLKVGDVNLTQLMSTFLKENDFIGIFSGPSATPDAIKRLPEQAEQNKENSPGHQEQQSHIEPNRKRMGILRRLPDNENRGNVLPLPPRAPQNVETITNSRESNSNQLALANNNEKESAGLAIIESIAKQMELKAPKSITLKSSFLPSPERTGQPPGRNENAENGTHVKEEIPFWLRPTPVQPYPYNFIMAVRKKLESITHPVVNRRNRDPVATDVYEYGPSESISPIKMHPQMNKLIAGNASGFRPRDINSGGIPPVAPSNRNMNKEPEFKMPNLPQIKSKDYEKPLISIKKSSIGGRGETEAPIEETDDTLSLSSGILSHSSPEKKRKPSAVISDGNQTRHTITLSPLSTDVVDGMHITLSGSRERSIEDQKFIASHVNFERGTNIQRMLNDFNESLSQVIEVNKKLHNALSNPPSLRQSKTSSVTYSDDFEDENQEKEIKTSATDTVYSANFTEYRSGSPSNRTKTTEALSSRMTNNPSATTLTRQSSRTTIEKSTSRLKSPDENTYSQHSSASRSVENRKSTYRDEQSDRMTIETISVIDDEEIHTVTEASTQRSASRFEGSVKSFEHQFSNDAEMLNTSIGSDIMAVFNRTSMRLSDKLNSTASWAEENISYSNLGMVS